METGRILTARGLFVDKEDAFFMHLNELEDLLHEHCYSMESLRQTIAIRRREYKGYQDKSVAERIGRRMGRPLFSREDVPLEVPRVSQVEPGWSAAARNPGST